MVIVLTCIFAACDKGGAQDKNYTVTIHPDNGQADFVWDTKTDIPVITKYGYHIVGFYLDEDMTISTTFESLKATNLTADLNVYVKWEKDSVPPKTKIVTKNLLCDYDTRALSGKVSNSTTVFSFNDEITVEKGTTYTISTDINGINVIPSKTVNLEIGDNIFYVLVSNEDELTLYTATVRRKPIYTVTFDTLGGTEVEAQQVEEDAFATAPTTEKNGCTFDKWDWDFSTPITDNTTITAIWNAFAYNIVYDFNIPADSVSQEVDNSMNPTTYTVDDTIYFAAPTRKGYYLTGWSVSHISKGTTGTITTTAQWRLIPYEIIYDFGDSNSVSKATNNELNPYYYTIENEIAFAEPARAGYTFVSWDKNIEKGTTGAQTITASWDVIQHNISYVLNGWTNAESNKNTYTIEDQKFDLQDGINGESLFCGWYLDGEYTNCIETIDASTMRDYTIYAMPDCGATKGLSIENGVVKGYSGASNEVIIPSFYKGYAVNSLIETSFKDCVEIVSVEIPDSVKSIGQGAFSGCSSLENITIPFVGAKAGVTSSDTYQYPFGYIFGTVSYDGGVATTQYYYGYDTARTTSTTYYIPSSLKSVIFIGEDILYGAFDNCSGLTSITFGNSVRSIGDDAFSGCSGLTSVCITDIAMLCAIRFKSFTSNPLYYAHELYLNGELVKDLTIPNGVTSIGNYAFYNYSDLTSIVLPDSVTWVGRSSFFGCNLIKITGPSNAVSTVAKQCDSKAIAEIVITSGASIGDSAFSSCSGLISVTIPNSVTSIGKDAFYKCSGLTSVTIPEGVTSIGDSAFYNCTGLTSVTIGNSVTSIGDYAFRDCSGLTSVTIGNSVTSIGNWAFSGCNKLQDIYIADIAAWCNISGLYNLMDYGSSNKNLYLNNELVTSVSIPDEVTAIPSCAFSSCNLTKILGPSDMVSAVVKQCKSKAIEEIVITSGTSISDSAFNNCTGLTSITIPDSVTSIGTYAFSGCDKLQDIYITDIAAWCNISGLDNLMRYGTSNKNLYLNNELVTSVSIIDEVTAISSYAFYGCILTKITGPSDMVSAVVKQCDSKTVEQIVITSGTSISDSAFRDCTGLTSVTIPNSVTSIGEYAFYNCTGLTSVTIGGNVTSIGNYAFRDCSGLTSVTIGNSVTSIGDYAFYGCSKLQDIYITDIAAWCNISGVNYLMAYGASNKNLYLNNELVTSLTIPDEVTVIPSYAFYGCKSIVSATISDNVTSVGGAAFSGCTVLTKISGPSGMVSVVAKQCNSKTVEQIVITSGTSISDSAFRNCTGLMSVTIPNSVTSIGNYAFSGCDKLQDIYITDIAAWCNISGVNYLMAYGASNKNLYLNNELVTSLTIPDSVTSIGGAAFSGCSGLTSITIPDSVTSIGDDAFRDCSGLISVSLGNGVRRIGDSAFNSCEKLTSITIPHGVESIGNYAFLGCWRLIEVHNKSSLTIIAGSSDNGYVASYAKNVYTDTEGDSKLSTENDYVVYTEGTEKILVDYTGTKTELTLPSYITQINDWAFSNCAELTSVTIPDSVTSLGYSAFSGCTGLTIAIIGNGVTNVGWSAFDGCTGLASLTIPNSVTSIGSNAFRGCSSLTSITIPNSVTSIGLGAFDGCSGLTRIIVEEGHPKYHSVGNCLIEKATKTLILGCQASSIPSDGSVTSIGNHAFDGCTGLTSVTIPNSVTSIGNYAFYGCSGLTSINFEGTKEQWNAITKGDNWNNGVATDCTITCSDGTI